MKFKSETFDNFKKFKSFVERQNGCRLKTLQTDRCGEFLSIEFIFFYEEKEIDRELTSPYTQEQNGAGERQNHKIVKMGKSMMEGICVLKCFWAENVATVVYLLNVSPTKTMFNQTSNEA